MSRGLLERQTSRIIEEQLDSQALPHAPKRQRELGPAGQQCRAVDYLVTRGLHPRNQGAAATRQTVTLLYRNPKSEAAKSEGICSSKQR